MMCVYFSLIEAYDTCISMKDKETMLSNVKSGKAMRYGKIIY